MKLVGEPAGRELWVAFMFNLLDVSLVDAVNPS